MASILDNKTIAELVVQTGEGYEKINPETLATIVEDVTGTTTETEKTVQEHIDNKDIHLTQADIEDLTSDKLVQSDIVAGANITVTPITGTNQVLISTTDHPVDEFLVKTDIVAGDDTVTVTPSETDNTVSITANFPDTSKYLIQENIKPGNQNITVEYVPNSNNILISSSNNSYTAGEGIAISDDNVVTNIKPDQTVVLNAGRNIAITGDYPSFTITGTNDATLVEWAANTQYVEGVVVIYENSLFECIEAHTSTTGFDETKFKLLAGFSAAREFFYSTDSTTSTITLQDEIPNKETVLINVNGVLQQSQNYELEPDHKTLTFVEPIPAGQIIEVMLMGNMTLHTYDERANITQWEVGDSFAAGNVCIYDGAIYLCIEDNVAAEPFDQTKWQLLAGYSKKQYFFDITTETNTITLPTAVEDKNSLMVNIGNTVIQSDNYELDTTGTILTFNENVEAGARIEVTVYGNMTLLNTDLPETELHSMEYLRVKEDESGYELITKDVLKTDLDIETLTAITDKPNYIPMVNHDASDYVLVSPEEFAGEVGMRDGQEGFSSSITYGEITQPYPEYLIEANDTITVQPGSIMDSTGEVLIKLTDAITKNTTQYFAAGNGNGSALTPELEDWIQPIMTSSNTPLGVVVTSSAQTDREGWRVMDGLKQTGNGWLTDQTSATWYYTAIYPLRVTSIDFYNQGSGMENWSKDIDVWVREPSNVVASFTAVNADYGLSQVTIPNPQNDPTIGLTIKNSYGIAVGANEIDIHAFYEYPIKNDAHFNVFVISNDDGTIVDIGTSTEETPTLPDGFTRYAKVGYYSTDSNWHVYNNYPTNDVDKFEATISANKLEQWVNDGQGHAIKVVEQWGSSTPSNGRVNFTEPFKSKVLYAFVNGEKVLTTDLQGFTVATAVTDEISWMAKGY